MVDTQIRLRVGERSAGGGIDAAVAMPVSKADSKDPALFFAVHVCTLSLSRSA